MKFYSMSKIIAIERDIRLLQCCCWRFRLLGWDAILLGEYFQTFCRTVMSPFSGSSSPGLLKIKAVWSLKTPANTYPTITSHIQGDFNHKSSQNLQWVGSSGQAARHYICLRKVSFFRLTKSSTNIVPCLNLSVVSEKCTDQRFWQMAWPCCVVVPAFILLWSWNEPTWIANFPEMDSYTVTVGINLK